MTILAFYPVNGMDRHQFDCEMHEDIFRTLYEKKLSGGDIKLYDIEAQEDDHPYGDLSQYGILTASDFQEDYNDEILDNGEWWTIVLVVPSDDIKEIIGYE